MIPGLFRNAPGYKHLAIITALLTLILSLSGAFTPQVVASKIITSTPGLTTTITDHYGRPIIMLRSPDRFILEIDEAGIYAWYALAIDPHGQTNLVAPDAHLLEHHLADGTRVNGILKVTEQSPVRTRIVWQGQSRNVSITITYTIWAGGQIAVTTSGPVGIYTTVHTSSAAIAGATLQEKATVVTEGHEERNFLLFLDAWSGESKIFADEAAGLAEAGIDNGVIQSIALPNQPLTISLPSSASLRQPRFEIADWPAEILSIHRGKTLLVNGQDYLAHWNPATQLLNVQYLHLLPADDPVGHTFQFSATPAAPSIALGIAGRTDLDENGMLTIDGNMPSARRTETTSDIFKIPYIQSSNTFTAIATIQEAPEGAGIEFVLQGFEPVRDFTAPFEQNFTFTNYGEYKLEAFLIDSAGTRIATDTIELLGYGHIIISIGDSITAGLEGDKVTSSSGQTYPVVNAATSPVSSKDKRNFYQYANFDISNDSYYRGYQVTLNDLLTECTGGIPVFILNDGFPGLNTWFPITSNLPNPYGAGTKVTAFNRHIAALDARYVIIGLGTNDVSRSRNQSNWIDIDVKELVTALNTSGSGLNIWFAKVPWRPNEQPVAGSTKTRTELYYDALTQEKLSSFSTITKTVKLGPDFYTYFKNNPAQIADNVHPTSAGLEGMAQLWNQSLCGSLPRLGITFTYLPLVRQR